MTLSHHTHRSAITSSLAISAVLFSGLTFAAADEGADAGFADDGLVNVSNTVRNAYEGSTDTHARVGQSVEDIQPNVEPAALPTDDGIDYSYERVCTSQPEENLDPSYCVALNAQCDAQEDGILVEWIEIDRNQSPPTQTPTGRNGCLYPGQPPVAPTGGEPVAGEPAEEPIVITLTEFESQPIIAAAVISQPQNFGLRNANSNVYAEADEQEFTFGFRNADIRLRAWPVSYEWNYGDGTSRTTADGGGPAQDGGLDVETSTSHKYTETGDYDVNLVTYFAGDYSVDGGPWQPVAGEAAVASEPHLMSIWRSERHSVAENCIENPDGVGC